MISKNNFPLQKFPQKLSPQEIYSFGEIIHTTTLYMYNLVGELPVWERNGASGR